MHCTTTAAELKAPETSASQKLWARLRESTPLRRSNPERVAVRKESPHLYVAMALGGTASPTGVPLRKLITSLLLRGPPFFAPPTWRQATALLHVGA